MAKREGGERVRETPSLFEGVRDVALLLPDFSQKNHLAKKRPLTHSLLTLLIPCPLYHECIYDGYGSII